MIKTIRVMLVPNNKQKTKLFQYAGTARFAYNWALGKEQENYEKGRKFLYEDEENPATMLSKEGIGIDLGIKDLAVRSDENKYPNINRLQKIRKLEKRKRRLQRSLSRRYEKNKKGESYCKTGNIIKSEKKLLKLNHRLTNIRQDYLHHTTSDTKIR